MSADLVIAGYVRIAKQDLDGARLLNRAVGTYWLRRFAHVPLTL